MDTLPFYNSWLQIIMKLAKIRNHYIMRASLKNKIIKPLLYSDKIFLILINSFKIWFEISILGATLQTYTLNTIFYSSKMLSLRTK